MMRNHRRKKQPDGSSIWRMVFYLIFISMLTGTDGAHEPARGAPAFIRMAVESPPEGGRINDILDQLNNQPTSEFGDMFLPLRSAVESVPAATAALSSPNTRTFIRDSVEYSPVIESDNYRTKDVYQSPNSLKGVARMPGVSQLSGQYSAFYVPNSYDTENPQPFRYGSPYQQLVDIRSSDQISPEILKQQKLRDYSRTTEVRGLLKKGTRDDPERYKVICYITNWSFYRKDLGQFVPEYLDSSLCTHIIYSFASLDPEKLTVKEFDSWADVDNDLYRRTINLPGNVPVLLAIGGWTDSSGDKYSKMISNPSNRLKFIQGAVQFLKRYGFSGLHFDWNYPKCWQSDCRKGPTSDKPNFTKFIEELGSALRSDNLLLGVALSGYKEVITEAYEVGPLSRSADFLTVMTYDYHGSWENQTGNVSPLYGRPNDKYPQYNTDFTINLLIKAGAVPEKLVMGVPFYGQSFTLKESYTTAVGEGMDARGPGNAGEFTRQPGMLAYYEICNNIRKQKWVSGRDSAGKSGPYATIRNQWVGYEDPESIRTKSYYAIKMKLGGIAAWTIDLDDFMNSCCLESFPLLKSINRIFGRLSTSPPNRIDCARPITPSTPPPAVMTTFVDNGIPGNHDHTTWPSWTTKSTTAWWQTSPQETSEWWSTPTPTPVTTRRTTTTTTEAPTTTERVTTTRRTTEASTWWSNTQTQSTWWPQPTTTTTTTAEEPDVSDNIPPIPVPVNVKPEVVHGMKCEPGDYKADPTECNIYYRCVYGELTRQQCAGGLHWNQRETLCDWPKLAKCNVQKDPEQMPTTQRPLTTQRPTTTTQRATTTRQSTTKWTTQKPEIRKCVSGQYTPHEDCGSFYICVNGIKIPQECGPGLQWSQTDKACDTKENVKCVSTRKYLRLIKSRASLDDPCEGNTHVPYPGDCNKYLRCLHGQLQKGECAPGLHWNQDNMICDWPAHSKCTESNEVDGNELDDDDRPTYDSNEVLTTKRPTTTTERPITPKPQRKPNSGYYKLVCYFTNWAWYRKGIGRYTPDDIDTDLCTHIVYGFAVLDYSELTIRTHDSWADIDNKFYDRVASLKDKGVKVSLALGGWNDSQGDKYSRLVRSPSARAKFVKQAYEFVVRYGFEGLDLDWEYPVCWQTECNKGFADEKAGFTALVRELSDKFKPEGLLLSTAVSPSKQIIDKGYDVPELSKYFDWIAVMTYDFHGQWDKKTGHVAPLYEHPDDDITYFNANFSLNYWIEKGAPTRKIVMGMPLYGQSFTLSDTKKNGLNSRAPGPGEAGEFTRAAGFLAYYEICDRIYSKGWNVVQDQKGRMGPYAYNGNQWVSFDDKNMLRKKSQLVRQLNLGGGMVWALDLDDFKNRCGEGAHPLLSEIQQVLSQPGQGSNDEPVRPTDRPTARPTARPTKPNVPCVTHKPEPEEVTHESEADKEPTIEDIETLPDLPNQIGTVDKPSEGSVESNEVETPTFTTHKNDYKIVCYFTNWAWYRQSGGKYVPEDIDSNLCTHVVYGFAVLNRDSLTIRPHDSWADIDNKFYERVVALKAKGIKVTVAIGGWNDSAGDKYSRLVRNPSARSKFIRNVVEFIEKYNFDGLDLDWEYPVCWQVDCKKGYADEKESFAQFVEELAKEFRPRKLLLSSAVSPSKVVIDHGYDVPTLSKNFDWIAVMTYDFHGQWDKQTGHVAPMYEHPDDTDLTFNANYSIHYWIEKGADRKKLVMGMPMYGQSFSLAENKRNSLNSPTYGGGEAGEATRARGFLAYYEICENIRRKGWKVVRDKKGRMGPYAYLRDQWVSFDDTYMIRHKSEFVKAMGLGGAMIWALDLDDFRNVCECEEYPLLRTINRVLRGYPKPDPRCKLEEVTAIVNDEPVTSKPSPTKKTTIKPQLTTTTSRPTHPVNDLSCRNRLFQKHDGDCNKFYQCQFGILMEQNCPAGLHWNEDHCDWPQNVHCSTNIIEHDDIDDDRTTTTRRTTTKRTTERTTTTTTSEPEIDFPKPVDYGEYKVVCYFTNWAWYRPGEGKYTPDDIDETLCTHVVYGFAVLNSETLTIRTHDSWADIDNRFYERVVALRRKGIRVTLAIGGWNDSLGDKYSRLVRDKLARARFIEHAVAFIEKYNFEGLDLDWEYPVCWQVDCKKGHADEKESFAKLVVELSQEFRPRGWLLSAAVSPSKMVIDAGYDVPTLSEYFDWIAVMTYDFHGNWDKQTGHVAPLYYTPGDTYDYFNANFTIHYWMSKGAPAKKLVMGMPLYGQSFSLTDSKRHGLNDKSIGPGEAGKFTRAGGFLAYYEICEKVNRGGWTVVRDEDGRIGPYAYSKSQWVSYDDVEDIRRKTRFLKDLNLGGGMVWALDLDDFRGRCGCGKHPLLSTINQELRGMPGPSTRDCT